MKDFRIGHGYDAHRFGPGDHLVIGGVRIEHDRGVVAHSDGDVLIHAVCDALLGAMALGDIGRHFPDSDETWKGVESRKLLRRVLAATHKLGYRVCNLDGTVVAQAPRLQPHVQQMRENLAEDLGIGTERVNVKATTTEQMGFTGRGEGIAAHAVVLLTGD
jgi:2-C-methyl-D-erythritol 2,4-cyclodiphosphate synthase